MWKICTVYKQGRMKIMKKIEDKPTRVTFITLSIVYNILYPTLPKADCCYATCL